MNTTDAGMVPFVTGISNCITAYLPAKWSRWFPLIPIALGAGYAFLARPGETDPMAATTGPLSIGLYSVIRNVFGTKPKDAK